MGQDDSTASLHPETISRRSSANRVEHVPQLPRTWKSPLSLMSLEELPIMILKSPGN